MESSWFRVLTKVEQINDKLINYSWTLIKTNPTKKCTCEWGDNSWTAPNDLLPFTRVEMDDNVQDTYLPSIMMDNNHSIYR